MPLMKSHNITVTDNGYGKGKFEIDGVQLLGLEKFHVEVEADKFTRFTVTFVGKLNDTNEPDAKKSAE